MIEYIALPQSHYPLLKKYFKQHKVRGRVASHDVVWVALVNQTIVSCCKFSPVNEAWLLTSVHTASEWRGKKIASGLLQRALQSAPMALYTFPYRNLVNWYVQFGFKICQLEQISHAEIVKKWHSYQMQGRNIEIMEFNTTH